MTTDLLTAAAALIRLAHPADASLHRALVKAESRLMLHPWRMAGGWLEITSESHPNTIHMANRGGCTCRVDMPWARGICWHRAAAALLDVIAATGHELLPALPLPDMALMEDYGDYDPNADFLDQPIKWSISE
jgi:hypothetical protein